MKIVSPSIKAVLKTGRFEISYRVYERGGPHHLICLNGIQQSMAMWQGFVARFAEDFRIILLDFPGQGKGRTLSGRVRASLGEEVDIVYELMKKTGVNHDASFCTASWGGIVALAFASKHPYAVKRLLLGSIGTRANPKMTDMIQKGCALDQNDRAQFSDIIIRNFGQNLPESVKSKIGLQFQSMSKENLQAFCEHGLNVLSVQNLSGQIDFTRIRAQTVLVRGEEDTIVDLEDVEFLASQIPSCQLKIIKNVGHFLHLESEHVFSIYRDLLSHDVEPSYNCQSVLC
jgi:pimeloyl-ACP methyl ester carboxylesterase